MAERNYANKLGAGALVEFGARPQRLELERWSNQFHAMIREKLLEDAFLVLWDLLPDFAHFPEKVLHTAGWLKKHEHLSTSVTGHGESVGNLTRCKRGITRVQAEGVVAHTDDKLTPNDVKPLVLKVMAVKCRATFRFPYRIIDAKVAAGVATGEL